MTVALGSVTLDKGTPGIVAVVGPEDCVLKSRRAAEMGADILELRADLFPNLSTLEGQASLTERIKEIKKHCPLPILFTVRGAGEGGQFDLDDPLRGELYMTALPFVAAMDFDLSAQAVRDEIAPMARTMGCAVIMSFHDMDGCPPDAALEATIAEGFAAGASIVKLAVTPHSKADVARLATLTERHSDKDIVMIAMGDLGRVSRVAFPCFGSRLTYGQVEGDAIAPGQLKVNRLRLILDMIL